MNDEIRMTNDDGEDGGAWTNGLVQPVLEPQSGHLREVGRVAREQRRVMGEDDAGDFQVHGADANCLARNS